METERPKTVEEIDSEIQALEQELIGVESNQSEVSRLTAAIEDLSKQRGKLTGGQLPSLRRTILSKYDSANR